MPSVRSDNEDSDVSSRLERLEQRMQSDAGKAGYKIAMMVIGVLLTALLTVSTVNIAGIKQATVKNAEAASAQDKINTTQTGDIKYMSRRIDALEVTTSTQITTLQKISERVAVNTDKIDAINVSRTRPGK